MRRCDGRVLRQQRQRQRQRLRLSSSSCTWVVLSLSKCVVFINNSTATAAQGSSAGREGEAEWVGQARECALSPIQNGCALPTAAAATTEERNATTRVICFPSLSLFLLRFEHVATAQVRQRSAQIEVARSCAKAALIVAVVVAVTCCCCCFGAAAAFTPLIFSAQMGRSCKLKHFF